MIRDGHGVVLVGRRKAAGRVAARVVDTPPLASAALAPGAYGVWRADGRVSFSPRRLFARVQRRMRGRGGAAVTCCRRRRGTCARRRGRSPRAQCRGGRRGAHSAARAGMPR